jgi:hypothetical protein
MMYKLCDIYAYKNTCICVFMVGNDVDMIASRTRSFSLALSSTLAD